MKRLSTLVEMEVGVVENVGVELLPSMFNESDGNVAKGRRQLGANPSATNLLVGVVEGRKMQVSRANVCNG